MFECYNTFHDRTPSLSTVGSRIYICGFLTNVFQTTWCIFKTKWTYTPKPANGRPEGVGMTIELLLGCILRAIRFGSLSRPITRDDPGEFPDFAVEQHIGGDLLRELVLRPFSGISLDDGELERRVSHP